MRILMVVLMTILAGASDDVVSWHRESRLYRLPLSFEPNTQLEDSFTYPTLSLFDSDNLDPDCDSIVFVSEDDTNLEWWAETPCPGSTDSPETIFWLRMASPDSTTVFMYFGFNEEFTPLEVGLGRLDWDGSQEIRLYASESCPPGYGLANSLIDSGGDALYAAGCDSSGSSSVACATVGVPQGHVHNVSRLSVTESINSVVGVTPSGPICGVASFGWAVTPIDHQHPDDRNMSGDFDLLENNEARPAAFALRPCQYLNSSIPTRMEFDAGSSNDYIGLFLSRPDGTGASWQFHADSDDAFLAFDQTSHFIPAVLHSHPSVLLSSLGETWQATGEYVDPDGIVELSGSVWIRYGQPPMPYYHAHPMGDSLPFVIGDVLPDVPDHIMVHVYERRGTYGISNEGEEMLYVFLSGVPPLGFVARDELALGYVKGYASVETATSELEIIPNAPHRHGWTVTSLPYEIPPGFASAFKTSDCGGTFWPYGDAALNSGGPHSHEWAGVTSYVSEKSLPPHATVLFATRLGSVRDITFGELEFYVDPAIGDGPGSGGISVPTIVGISVGVVFFVIVVLVLVIVVGVVVVLAVLKKEKQRMKHKILNAEMPPIDSVMLSESKKALAKINVRETLFEVDFDAIDVKKKIAKGGSNAVVFLAEWEEMTVAFKCFMLADFLEQQKFLEFEKEVEILASVNHPNILRFYGATLRPPRVGFLVEYCEHGDLKDYVEANPDLSLAERIRLLKETSFGIKFLHSKEIIHRDMKCQNVLVDSDYHCKVMDFGMSRFEDSTVSKTVRVGTSHYMAPEVTIGGHYTHSVDIFSLGIMMFEILTGRFDPYGPVDFNVEIKVAMDENFRPELSEKEQLGLPDNVVQLMKLCWAGEPEKRPTAGFIVESLESSSSSSSSSAAQPEEEVSTQTQQGSLKIEDEDDSSSGDESSDSSDED